MRILGFGDNIVDRFLDRRWDFPGGNAVNVAVYANRIGADSAYLGVFGNDDSGAFLRDAIEAEGVSTAHSLVRRGESGVSSLRVIDGERTFLGWNGGGVTVREPIDLDDERLSYAAGFDLAHSSVYSRTEGELHRLREAGVLVSFDFSSEPEFRTDEYFTRVAPHTDLALISCSEASAEEADTTLARLIEAGARLALATRGIRGAVITNGTAWASIPAKHIADPTTIVDTMGCGDAFLAGFVVSLLGGGWRTGGAPDPRLFDAALRAGATAARDQCFIEAAFARGRPTPSDPTTPVD